MFQATGIARHVLAASSEKGEPITNLKLQKLIYYCQAWSLAHHGKALFSDDIQAWVHGPVVPSIFREYKEFKWTPIEGVKLDRRELDSATKKHIANVLGAYGSFDAHTLKRMTHNEKPWIEARAGLPPDAVSSSVITHESMKKYYSSL